MDPEPDTRIGSLVDDRYSILEAMAAGSMGAVYKAERVPVGKLVAIKFLHASYATDAEFLARFERETRVMSKLAHPNCVSVVDFGVWRDSPYLVMEFVSGTTLRAVIDDVSIEPARALTLARQIAIGLAHAHSHGIVHRDVKPANIMITEQLGTGESVRILDFGLARLRDSTGTGRDPTLHNVVVGTPNYMAPEQTVAGGKVDERTDVYAAGVVLYEMIVGEKPFAAEDTLSLLAMHRAAPIPRLANHVDGDLPDGLQELVDRAMAKDPADRYQTALALAEAIEAVAAAPAGSAKRRHTSPALGVAPTLLDVGRSEVKPAAASRAWRKPVLGAVILLGGAAATAGYLIHRAAADEAAFDANVVTVAPRDEIGRASCRERVLRLV